MWKVVILLFLCAEVWALKPVLLTDVPRARLSVRGDRFLFPGDYAVHEEFGVAKYLGVRMVDITPSRASRTWQPTCLFQFHDAVASYYQVSAEREFWFFRSSSTTAEYELSSWLNTKKWQKRKTKAVKTSQSAAAGLIELYAKRSGVQRPPYLSLTDNEQYAEFLRGFKYTPTEDQLNCFEGVESDMVESTRPMDRLICGDVGFGKTEVALRAICRAVLSGRQVALLAPTRILANQHERTIKNRMPGVNVQLLRGGGKSQSVKDDLESGECRVVVGTHALLTPDVSFKNLGLVVVDEEQRFGVNQKERLKQLTLGTDVLTLSATPIPRTMKMALSGLREMSIMSSPPKGRKNVNTTSTGPLSDEELVAVILKEKNRGGQVYVVCPRVQQVEDEYSRLLEILPSNCTVGFAHGQNEDLESRIDLFVAGEVDVLVATTVIENGIDIANANTIIILNAGFFGQSALYQLRGRVGRSDRQAYCYLCHNSTEYGGRNSLSIAAEGRLTNMVAFQELGSGLDLSKRDMEARGHGSILGTEQSGDLGVGLDLERLYLEREVEALRAEVVLSVSETRLQLGSQLEELGAKVLGRPLPEAAPQVANGNGNGNGNDYSGESDNMSAVSSWERELAAAVLSSWAKGDGKGHSAASRVASFQSASTPTALQRLAGQWAKDAGGALPKPVMELLSRSFLRMQCRKVGISVVILVQQQQQQQQQQLLVCRLPTATGAKWNAILAPAVPADLKQQVAFEELRGGGGIITITNGEGAGAFAWETAAAASQVMLRLVNALAVSVDAKLKARLRPDTGISVPVPAPSAVDA